MNPYRTPPTLPPCDQCGGTGEVCNQCELRGQDCKCPEDSLPTPMPCPSCRRSDSDDRERWAGRLLAS